MTDVNQTFGLVFIRKVYKIIFFKIRLNIWMHICGAQLLPPSDHSDLILNCGCEAAVSTLLITLNAGRVPFLKESHEQMSVGLCSGAQTFCVGFREQAVVTSFC